MHTTIDIDDALYSRLETEAARRGRTVRDLVTDGVRRVLDASATEAPSDETPPAERGHAPLGSAFGALREYAENANGVHDMASIRASIARGRAAEWTARERAWAEGETDERDGS